MKKAWLAGAALLASVALVAAAWLCQADADAATQGAAAAADSATYTWSGDESDLAASTEDGATTLSITGGGTLTLTADTTADVVVSSESAIDVTIDLAGCTLTGTASGATSASALTATYSDGAYEATSSTGSVVAVFGGCADLTVTDSSSAGTGAITGGVANRGGGIYFAGDTLTLEAGSVSGNSALNVTVSASSFSSWSGSFTSYGLGGGVYVDYGAVFVMDGGDVSDNTANASGGGVYVAGSMSFTEAGATYSTDDASFALNGGEVGENEAGVKGAGVYAGGAVAVCGGSVSGNELTGSAGYGAGVYVSAASDSANNAGFSDQYFIYYLSDMTSSERSANEKGSDGAFCMTGGEVSENTGAYYGGGVYACGSSFDMSGGEVSGNSAAVGGGICLETDGDVSGGEVSGNTATGGGSSSSVTADGGGIYVYAGAALTMTGGSVSGNAAAYGAGIYLYDGGSAGTELAMTGGSVTGNAASSGAGGIYNDSSTLYAYGAGVVIANNTATTRAADVRSNSAAVATTLPNAAGMGQTFEGTDVSIDGWYSDATGSRWSAASVTSNVETPSAQAGELNLVAAYGDASSTMTITVAITWDDAIADADRSITLLLMRSPTECEEDAELLQSVTLDAGSEGLEVESDGTWSYVFTMARSSDLATYYVYGVFDVYHEGWEVGFSSYEIDFSESSDYAASVEVSVALADVQEDGEAASYEASLSCGEVTWYFGHVEEAARYVSAAIEYAQQLSDDGEGLEAEATLTLLADAVVQETLELSVVGDESLTFDLAGCTLSMADADDDGNVYDADVEEASGSVCALSGTVAVASSAADEDGEAAAGAIIGGDADCGGGIYIEEGADVALSSVSIVGNTAQSGGGVYMACATSSSDGASLAVGEGVSISNNSATGTDCTLDETTGLYTYAFDISGTTTETDCYEVGFACGGGVYVGDCGSLVMDGGEVCGNSATRGGGVYVAENAEFTMNGGSVSDNEAWTATVEITVSTGSTYTLVYDYQNLEEGGSYTGGDYGILGCAFGGGVYVDFGGSFVLNGGAVSENASEWSGGGVYIAGELSYTIQGAAYSKPAAVFTMYGGSIANNTCQRKGGGIMLAGEGVIYAGEITGNSATGDDLTMLSGDDETTTIVNASGLGGGIYVSGEDDTDNAGNIDMWLIYWTSNYSSAYNDTGTSVSGGEGTLTIYSTVITENTASVLGGGIWSCHAGALAMNLVSGAAVFGNDAQSSDGTKSSSQAGDDIASVAKDDDSDDTIELSSTILAGGTVMWYYDGAVDDETHEAVGTATDQYTDANGTVHTVPRYDNEADDEHDAIDEDELTISTSFAAKAVVSEGDAAAALAAATVTISGNSASRGGGIGNNGTVVSGEKSTDADTMDIAVSISKTWEADTADERPESVYVVVYYTLDGMTYSATALTLCADDDSIDNDPDTWTASFEVDGLPQGSVISVKEVTVTGYLASYAGSADNGTEQNDDGTYTLVLNGDAYGSYTLQSGGTDDDGAYTYELLLTNTAEEGEADEAWSIQLVKYGTTSVAGNELAGATFKLYAGSMDEEGLLAQAQSADGDGGDGSDGSDDASKGLVTWEDADGNTVELSAGTTYYIVESDAPSGYLLADVLVVSFEDDGTPVVQLGTGEDAQTLGGADDADGGSYVAVDEDACTIRIALTDAALYELPQTAGGMMWLWYVAVALAAACGVGLLGTRRPCREGAHART